MLGEDRHGRAEHLLAADEQERNLDGPRVLCVEHRGRREGAVHLEGRTQVRVITIGRGVVLHLGVGDDAGVGHADLEEVPEVDRLAILNEGLGQVGDHVELTVPERNADLRRLLEFDRGEQHLHEHHAAGHVRVQPGERVGHQAADVVPDDVHRPDAESAHQLGDVLGEAGRVVPVDGRGRTADAAQVHRDHREPLGQPRHDPPPLEPVLREPVDQHQRGAGAAADVVDPRAVHGHGGGLDVVAETGQQVTRCSSPARPARCRTQMTSSGSPLVTDDGRPAYDRRGKRDSSVTWDARPPAVEP